MLSCRSEAAHGRRGRHVDGGGRMANPRAEELIASLAAAVVEADAGDARSLAAVREALGAARSAGVLPAALATAAEALLTRLGKKKEAAGALADLGRLLDGDRTPAPPKTGR